ncbi:helix-turn-helix domain-containing protein, partial [Campylobacter upsaliensis]|uniref:helix-turn-helix domain-containing protein n=1 Tax=Campylobacter upsaliensis TaxID=28080 RepID=UPI00214A1FB1
MTKEKFKSLMQEAGIKSKKELAELMGLHYGTINNWGNTQGYPTYLNNYFHFIIKAKKYDEALKRGLDESEKPRECPLNIEALS